MKILSKILIICLGITLCFSCSDVSDEVPDEVVQQQETTPEINDKYLTDFLERNGYINSTVTEFQNGYFIDGCIYVSNEILLDQYEKAHSKRGSENLQAHTDNLIYHPYGSVRSLTYYIDGSVPNSFDDGGEWREAIHQAFAEWNNVKNYALEFDESQSSGADIVIFADDLGSGAAIAGAMIPDGNGNPGSFTLNGNSGTLVINTDFNNLSLGQKKRILSHEIGHTMGFKHTDTPYERDIYDGTNIVNGTWNDDPYSVMNSGGYYAPNIPSWTGFGFLDILAFRTTYPLDDNLKPCYVYQRLTNKGYYWTTDWSEYGSYTYDSPTSTGYEYKGFNGFMYETQVSGTVPIYLYYSPGSNWYNKSKDPYIDSNFPGWNKIGILGYAYATDGAGRQPVYQYYHPSKGFFNTLNYNPDMVTSDPNWSYNGIPYYAASIY